MRIIDENGNEMENYNPDEGYITYEIIIVAHHEAQPFIPDIFHYEVIQTYQRQGKPGYDVIRIIDIPGQQASEAWDETEPIMRFHEYSEEEKQKRKASADEAEAFRIMMGEE